MLLEPSRGAWICICTLLRSPKRIKTHHQRNPLSLSQHAAESLSPAPLVDRLLPYTEHKNPKVRARAAVVLEETWARAALSPGELTRVLPVAGRLVTDNVPEAREAAKKLLARAHNLFLREQGSEAVQPVLERALAEAQAVDEAGDAKSAWELYCRAILPGSVAIAVLKVQQ